MPAADWLAAQHFDTLHRPPGCRLADHCGPGTDGWLLMVQVLHPKVPVAHW